jgi:hypothetical protein
MTDPDARPPGGARPGEGAAGWEAVAAGFEPPVLLVSTFVGRGMYSLGEAIRERRPAPAAVAHVPVEEFLPRRAVAEDLRRHILAAFENRLQWIEGVS